MKNIVNLSSSSNTKQINQKACKSTPLLTNILSKSFRYSILLQILTGFILLYGFRINIPETDSILKKILFFEFFVQIVEGSWYAFILSNFRNIKKDHIVEKRYIDWIITTPIMIFSTILFMEYDTHTYSLKKNKNHKDTKNITLSTILSDKQKRKKIFFIFLYNLLMLVSGYLAEIEKKQNKKFTFLLLGFVFFFMSFYTIYINFVHTLKSLNLFRFLFIVWFLYGIAAFFPLIEKNIFYNVLDIIAKNFYGLFLVYEINNVDRQRQTEDHIHMN